MCCLTDSVAPPLAAVSPAVGRHARAIYREPHSCSALAVRPLASRTTFSGGGSRQSASHTGPPSARTDPPRAMPECRGRAARGARRCSRLVRGWVRIRCRYRVGRRRRLPHEVRIELVDAPGHRRLAAALSEPPRRGRLRAVPGAFPRCGRELQGPLAVNPRVRPRPPGAGSAHDPLQAGELERLGLAGAGERG